MDTTQILKIQNELARRTLEALKCFREMQFARYAANTRAKKLIMSLPGRRHIDIEQPKLLAFAKYAIGINCTVVDG